jgi:hypothetical protein
VTSISVQWVNTVDDLKRVKQQQIQEVLAAAFPHPQAYSCSVLAYIRSHGQMIVEVVEMAADTYQPLYLELDTVWYFEGPLRWQGVDFRIASSEECHTFVNTGWITLHDHVDEFVRHHMLLILERPGFRVRVLAGNCVVSSNPPAAQIGTP